MGDKRGFTLIELLVTIALMLSILGIAIVSFITVNNRKKEESWKEVKNQIIVATKDYIQTNEYLLTGKEKLTVSLGMLVSEDYLNIVTNPKTGKKLNKCSYVSVTKNNNVYDYEYQDSNKTSCIQEGYIVLQEAGAPTIDVKMSKKPTGNDSWYTESVDAIAEVKTNKNGPIKEVKYCISSNTECEGYTNLPLTKDNKYKSSVTDGKNNYAIFIATNSSGKSITGFINYKKDTQKPTCSSNNGSTAWTNKSRTIKWTCNDTTSGCKKSEYSETFKTDTKSGKISIEDKAGNENTCTANVYVDVTKPTCTLNLSGNKGNMVNKTQWYKSDVNINAKNNDNGGSGIDKYGLATSTKSTNGKTSYKQSDETTPITFYGYVKDNAGNENSCNAKFGLEKSVTISLDINTTNKATAKNGSKVFNENYNVLKYSDTNSGNCQRQKGKQQYVGCAADTDPNKFYFGRSCMNVIDFVRTFNVIATSGNKQAVWGGGKKTTAGLEHIDSFSKSELDTSKFKKPYKTTDLKNNGSQVNFTKHTYQYTSPAGNSSNKIILYTEYSVDCGY